MLEKVAEFLVLTWECVEVFYVVTWVHNRVRTKRDLTLGYARHSFSEMRFPILRDLFLEVEFQAWFRSIVLGSWWVMILVNNTSQYSSWFRPFTSAMYPRSHSLRAFFWSHCCSVLQFVSPKSRGKFWLSASLFIYIYICSSSTQDQWNPSYKDRSFYESKELNAHICWGSWSFVKCLCSFCWHLLS